MKNEKTTAPEKLIADYLNALLPISTGAPLTAIDRARIDGACDLAFRLGYLCDFNPLEGKYIVAKEDDRK